MSFSIYNCSIPAFTHSLNNLSGLLDIAARHTRENGIDEHALTDFRLYPNMLPDIDAPAHEDYETTFAELKLRIQSTKDFLDTISPKHLEGAEQKRIVMQAGPHELTFGGSDYLNCWALPNLYFHVATAYNILRHNGVNLGKADFLGVTAFNTTPA